MGIFKKRAGGGPRQAARRSSRLWKQRFRKLGLYAVAVAAVCGVAFALWVNGSFSRMKDAAGHGLLALSAGAGFRVSEISVTGRAHVTQEEILAKLGISSGAPLFSVDPAQLQKKLVEISWVKSAAVARRLPGTVAIRITERRPAVLWQHQKKITVIDADGTPLDVDGIEGYGDLPLVVGSDAGKNAAALSDMLKAEPAVAELVGASARVGNRRWDLHLKNGIVVMLPEKDAELALARLARAEEKDHILGKNIATIDLRLPDRMTVEAGAKPAQDDMGKS